MKKNWLARLLAVATVVALVTILGGGDICIGR
jgi:hypothetical protein